MRGKTLNGLFGQGKVGDIVVAVISDPGKSLQKISDLSGVCHHNITHLFPSPKPLLYSILLSLSSGYTLSSTSLPAIRFPLF